MNTTVRLAACATAILLAASSPGLGQSTSPSPSGSSTEGGAAASGTSSPMTPSEREAKARLEAAGYTGVKDVKSTPEGISAKAMKDGKEVALVIDSSGKVKER